MVAISLRFLAGRYHATPWGRHVNEGAVEWPPSPWRIIRALVAVWKRTLPDLSPAQVEPILRVLCTPPEFLLPPASAGHTRHFMPWLKKGPDDRTLIFDAFAALDRCSRLVIYWDGATLDGLQRATLARILANLNSLGRSESWCEAALIDRSEIGFSDCNGTQAVSAPLNGRAPAVDEEIVRMLCPDPAGAFAEPGRWIHDPPWNICVETLQLHKDRWSDPPGSRWVQYTRPRDCLATRPSPSRPKALAPPRINVVRFVLDSTVLPVITETLTIAETARLALMSKHGLLSGRNGPRGRSDVLSGKDQHGSPLTGHGHAYYLPTDEDGDGRVDHLTLYAARGFGPDELRAIDSLRELCPRSGVNELYPIRVLLLGLGTTEEYSPEPLRLSKTWVSATPYIATRHAKTQGRHRINLASATARAEYLASDLRGQLAAVPPGLTEDVLSRVRIEPVWDNGVFRIAGRFRPIQFRRFRRKAGDDGGRRLAGAFRITFPIEVRGPLTLGWSSHFGMGLFIPVS